MARKRREHAIRAKHGDALDLIGRKLREAIDASGLDLAPFARSVGLSEMPVSNLVKGRGAVPKYKSIHALCRRVGHGIGPECFPWIARLDLVLAIMDQGESFTAFSKRIRVKHNLLTALLHEGTRLPFSHAQRVANALGQPVDDLDIAQPRQRLLGSQPPTPPDPSERYQGKTLGTPNLFRCAKVIRRLTALHLAIRNGTITPPWPHKTDSATWWQVEAEFRHAWQNHTPTGEDVAKARQTA